MVHVVLTIPKPSIWSIENIVNTFPMSIKREQIGLRTVIYFMLGLTMAWFLNTMGLDSSINMWSLTVLNFFLSASKVRWLELSQLSLCSEFDKENLIEFSLISLLLIHFTTVAMHLLSHGPHVTLVMWPTVTVTWPSVTLWQSHVILSHTPSCSCK